MFQVQFVDNSGEFCFADFSDMDQAYTYVDSVGGEVVSFDEYDDDYNDDYDGQPSEYDEWQDYYGGDDWDHGQYDEC